MIKGGVEKTFFICNPAAGAGLADERWLKFHNDLIANNIDFDYQFTTAPKNATKVARDVLKKGFRRIAIFGSDGTMNEVLQGIIKNDKSSEDVKIIFLPAGSSCDFAKKYPNNKSNIELIKSNDILSIDIGKIECNDKTGKSVTSYFFNNSSIGVISVANETFSSVKGSIRYIKRWNVDVAAVLAGLKAIVNFKPIACELKFDDEEVHFTEITNITVFKTPYFGGGMYYNVEVKQDDGLFNIAIVDSTSKLKLFTMIPALYAGTIFKKKEARHRTCKVLKFDTNRNFYIEMDGESAGYPPAKYTILKQAVNIVI